MMTFSSSSLSAVAPAVANHLWQSTAFAAVVWIATLMLRKNQARVRYGLWLAASVKFLLPFSLLIGLGGLLPRPHHAMVTMPVYSAVDSVEQPFESFDQPLATPIETHVSEAKPFAWLRTPEFIAGVWLCGVLVVLVVWCLRWRQVARTLQRSVLADSGREFEILRRLDGSEQIAIRISQELMEPGIFGIFRPVLIWPERLSERLDDEHIEAILVHERMHARRRDNLTAAIHMLVEAAFWFHPIVWWMERRMVEERERACDEAVVELGSSPEIYAESLLKAVRFCVESPLVCVAGISGADLSKRVRSIMTFRLQRLGAGRKVVLAALAFVAIAGPVALGVMRMIPMYGQILHATGPLPSFEVATIKPLPPMQFMAPPSGGTPPAGGRVAPNGEPIISQQEVHFSSSPRFSDSVNLTMTAKMLIDDAYNLPAFSKSQIIGGPDWADQTMYRVEAKIDDSQYAALLKLPSAQRVQQVHLMEQSLLAERFKLKVHFETREMPVYALEVAKNGPKLTPSAANPTGTTETHPSSLSVTGKGDGYEIKGNGVSPNQLILLLQQQPEAGNRMVVDQTGLKGHYDLSLNWTRQGSTGADAGLSSADTGPSFFTALKEQLGLQLVQTKGPAEVLVIDSIERPATVDGADVAVPAASAAPIVMEQEKMHNTMAQLPGFEVASIRPCKDPSQEPPIGHRPGANSSPGRLVTDCVELLNLIGNAYNAFADGHLNLNTQESPVNGGPSWLHSAFYVINAKAEGNPSVEMMFGPMMQALLEDRFHLNIHRQTSEGPVYFLTVAHGGTKLHSFIEGSCTPYSTFPPPPLQPGQKYCERMISGISSSLVAQGATLDEFSKTLCVLVDRPVIDKTGIPGRFDIHVEFSREGTKLDTIHLQGPSNTSDPTGPPSIFTALQEQLGLKLEPAKGPVDTIVIDHIDRPSEN